MRKKILNMLTGMMLGLVMLFIPVVYANANSLENSKLPDSLMHGDEVVFERVPDGCKKIVNYDFELGKKSDFIGLFKERYNTNTVLGYKYVNSSARTKSGFTIVRKYSYLHGSSIIINTEAEGTYTLSRTISESRSSEWNLEGSGTFGFDIGAVKTTVTAKAGYKNTDTVTIQKGESFNIGKLSRGTHDISIYMRGHRFDVEADFVMTSTDCNDGKTFTYSIGNVTFPTCEYTVVAD